MHPRHRVLIFSIVVFTAMWAMLGVASYLFSKKPPACFFISNLPFAIEAPGCYQLKQDMELKDLSGTAILIRTGNVHLDMKGHRITGPSSQQGYGVGIAAQGVQNVSIENGTIAGFLYGMRIEHRKNRTTKNFTVQNVLFENNGFRGAAIDSVNLVVGNSRVRNTGGTLFFPNASAIGLDLKSQGCRVSGNEVLETHPIGTGVGVAMSLANNSARCTVSHNVLSNSRHTPNEQTIGIIAKKEPARLQLQDNEVRGFNTPEERCFVISNLPYVIESSGCYQVLRDLRVTSPESDGIDIRVGNVHLDLKGHTLRGLSGLNSLGAGIHAYQGLDNITIKRGTISGFLYGIRVDRAASTGRVSSNLTIDRMIMQENGFRGITIDGANVTIKNSLIRRTGGTRRFPDSWSIGVELTGENCQLRDTSVVDTYPVGSGNGIAVAIMGNSQGCKMQRVNLRNSHRAGNEKTYGIFIKEGEESPWMKDVKINGFALDANRTLNAGSTH